MARIIVTDDDPQIRELLEQLLLSSGYDVVTAEEGGRCLALARTAPVDLLITDLIMPGMDGKETIRRFHMKYPKVPIIAMTGDPNLGAVLLTAVRLGAIRTLAKPFQPDELLDLVKAALRAPPADPPDDQGISIREG